MKEIAELSLSFFLTLYLLFHFIKFAHSKKLGQHIRQEGPDMHNYKEGTPTMGGIVFMSVAAGIALAFDRSPAMLVLVFTTMAFWAVGLADGLVQFFQKNSKGLTALQKIAFQVTTAAVAYVAVQFLNPHGYTVVPFLGKLELGWFYPIFAFVFMIGMSNAANLTDGLDGLAGGIYTIGAVGLVFLSVVKGMPLAMTITSIGAVLAFLFYNVSPARVFMGDVGSLAIGGYIGIVGVMYGYEIWMMLLFPIFIIEALSVVIQVTSFKTRKKRVFLMAPIHHHFEHLKHKGEKLTENQVTVGFWLFQSAVVIPTIGGIMWLAFH